jgi:hypothetical protein
MVGNVKLHVFGKILNWGKCLWPSNTHCFIKLCVEKNVLVADIFSKASLNVEFRRFLTRTNGRHFFICAAPYPCKLNKRRFQIRLVVDHTENLRHHCTKNLDVEFSPGYFDILCVLFRLLMQPEIQFDDFLRNFAK